MKPIVAVIGRPNVGKSTFFNCITRSQDALVDDGPGVTRDRIYGDALWDEVAFTLVDTGGFAGPSEDAFAAAIGHQVRQAMEHADVIIFLLDGKSGLSPFDRDIGNLLRSIDKPVFYAVNKIDTPEREAALTDFYALGEATLYPVSAAHRYGINDLLDALIRSFPPPDAEAAEGPEIRLAVVGRPNVGKSSLINRILGEERLVVSDVPGTTRDAVDICFQRRETAYRIVDTAGIRRKGRVTEKLEKFSVLKALRSLERCDVALIVLDASEGVTEQDISVAGYAFERGCGCVFVANKWDLLPKGAPAVRAVTEQLREAAKFLSFAPIVTVSAHTGQRVERIFPPVQAVYRQYATRLGTGQLNRIVEKAVQANTPPMFRGRRLKFFYATQVSSRPPTFVVFVNYPDAVHFSYRRYLLNQIRAAAGLTQTPLRLLFRPRSGKAGEEPSGRPERRAARGHRAGR
jgi:GTP-binding protein